LKTSLDQSPIEGALAFSDRQESNFNQSHPDHHESKLISLLLGFAFCAFLNDTAFAQAKKPNIRL